MKICKKGFVTPVLLAILVTLVIGGLYVYANKKAETTGFVDVQPVQFNKIPQTIDDGKPSITILSPNGGESLHIGLRKNITWKTNNFSTGEVVSIYLIQNLSGCFNLKPGYSCQPVIDPENVIVSNTASPGQYQWTPRATGNYYIRICKGLEKTLCDTSDSLFTILDPVKEAAYSSDKAPAITSISGPTSLKINEAGIWAVNAADSDGQNISYSMSVTKTYPAPATPSKIVGIKPSETYSSKINWKFNQSGTYLLEFTASDFYGKTASTSMVVNVQ